MNPVYSPARGSRRSGLLALHAAVLLFGVAGLFGKLLPLSPLLIVFGRTAFASLALGPLLLIGRAWGRSPAPESAAGWRLAVPGVVLAAHWVSFFRSIQESSVAVGLLTYSTFPLFTALIEPWATGERLRGRDVLNALLVLAGLAVMLPSFDMGDRVTRGACWGTLSGLTFAVLSVLNRRLARDEPAVRVAFARNLVAAAVLLPLLWATPGRLPAAPRGMRDLLLLAGLGVGCTALAHTLFIQGLRAVRARTASVVCALEAVYGTLLAFALLGEVPAPRTLAGGALVLAAVVLASAPAGAGRAARARRAGRAGGAGNGALG